MKILKVLIPLIVVFSLFYVSNNYVSIIRITGTSMNPTIAENSIMLVNKKYEELSRFDIIVIEYEGQKMAKRILGMPGEVVEIKEAHVHINGVRIEDPYNNYIIASMGPVTLYDEEYFLLGDNRALSLDSRTFGKINDDMIIGEVFYSILPYGEVN
ncbi:MAG: signal peptidase I [bacterium]